MYTFEKNLILALETGLDGGTVSILEKGKQIDYLVGSGGISKSEDVLLLIDKLLKKNNLRKVDIGFIAVSDSPGSLTGLRIGLAIAKGLADSLSAKVYQSSIMRAMALAVKKDGKIISAISNNNLEVYYIPYKIEQNQILNSGNIVKKALIPEFLEEMNKLPDKDVAIVINEKLKTCLGGMPDFAGNSENSREFHLIGGNFAEIVGLSVPGV